MAVPTNDWDQTRTTLIRRLKDWQDDQSWQEFFDCYSKLIHGFCLKRGLSRSEAQEVVQETMIAVARHMPEFDYDAQGSFKAWLLNMTRWRVADQLRKRPSAGLSEAESDTALTDESPASRRPVPATTEPGSDEMWEEEWRRNLMETAIGLVRRKLDPKKFQIFDLCVNKDWAPEKVATAFGIPVSQVYMAKHRVTLMIKKEVARLACEKK